MPPLPSEIRRTGVFPRNETYFLASKVRAKDQDATGFIKDIVELFPESVSREVTQEYCLFDFVGEVGPFRLRNVTEPPFNLLVEPKRGGVLITQPCRKASEKILRVISDEPIVQFR